ATICSCGTSTTDANGNRNSVLASECSMLSQRTIVGSRYGAPSSSWARAVVRCLAVTSTAPPAAQSSSILASMNSANLRLANADSTAASSLAVHGWCLASSCAKASAISSPCDGTRIDDALMQDRKSVV